MDNKNTNFSKIEDYLFGNLPDSDKKEFESEITTDRELQKEVNLHKLEHRAMDLLAQKELKANLNEWKKEKMAAEEPSAKIVSINKRRRLFVRLAAAASVLLVVGLFTGNLLNSQYDNDRIAGNFFDETSISDRANKGEMPTFPEVLIPGVQAMQTGNYETAANLFGQIATGPHLETAQILQAECYFQMKAYDRTITNCTPLANSTDDSIKEKAEWYLTLSNLALGNEDEAKALLQPILQNSDHSFYPYALELEQDLNSFWRKFSF